MLIQNFYSYLGRSASSLRRSVCVFISCIRAQKYMPVLICMALFFSSNSHSESTEGGYSKLEYKADYHQDTVELKFSGNPPKSIDGFAPYTIYSFNLKIGENEYPLREFNIYKQLLAKHIKPEDLNYDVHSFPKSELVFSYGLSFFQSILEHGKCISEYSSIFRVFLFWDTLPNYKLQACWKKVRGLTFQKKYYSFDITELLLSSIQSEIESMDTHKDLNHKEGDYGFEYMSAAILHDKWWSNDRLHPEHYLNPEHYRNITTYTEAIIDYFERKSTTIMEAYDKLILSENMLSNTKDYSSQSRGKTDILYKAVKPFESEQCEDELPNSLPITLHKPRLAEAAKNLASELCQYNPISFNRRASSNPPTKPREYNEHAAAGIYKENSTFLPYAFCDKYTCEIHMSETLYYRVSTHNQMFLNNFVDHVYEIRQYLLFKSKVPDKFSDCSNYCTISDIDALQHTINSLIDEIDRLSDYLQSFVSWMIIKYEKQLN